MNQIENKKLPYYSAINYNNLLEIKQLVKA